jgi:DNA-binding NarL/FixJ family response regulator
MTAPDVATVRVVTVDDQRPFRVAAAAVVRRAAGFELVGEAASGEEALVAVADLAPDLVLMDINMPGMSGIAATRAITAAEHPPVVFLCSTYQARDLPADAQEAGAAAYIDKEELASDLLTRLWAEHRPADGAATASATTG